MRPTPWTIIFVPVLASTACDAEVVRDGDSDSSVSADSTDGAGGADGPDVDPERQCLEYALINDHIPGCRRAWNEVSCEKTVRHANEFGCLDETLAFLHCAAVSCQTSAECGIEEETLMVCNGTDN